MSGRDRQVKWVCEPNGSRNTNVAELRCAVGSLSAWKGGEVHRGGSFVAKHAFAAYVVSINERGRPAERVALGNLKGLDFLHLLHGLMKDIEGQHLRAERTQHVLTVEDVKPLGRSVCFKTQYGRFGLNGRIINAQTAQVTHEYDDTESPVSPTRNMFVIPQHNEYGLLLAERYGGGGAATMIRSAVNNAMRSRFSDDFTVHVEAAQDTAAWQAYVQRASMTELNINRYRLSSDRADRSLVDVIGKDGRVFKPRRGARFPPVIKNQILTRSVRAHDLVGIEFSDEDEVIVSLDDGRQKRHVAINQIEPPALVYEVADDTADRPTDQEFYTVVRARVPDIANETPVVLPADWAVGEWTDEAKDVKMSARRD